MEKQQIPCQNHRQSTPAVNEWKRRLDVVLGGLLFLGLASFIVLGLIYGPSELREKLVELCALASVALLVRVGIIKEVVVTWTMLLLVCVVGPLFTIVFVGSFFGWW